MFNSAQHPYDKQDSFLSVPLPSSELTGSLGLMVTGITKCSKVRMFVMDIDFHQKQAMILI